MNPVRTSRRPFAALLGLALMGPATSALAQWDESWVQLHPNVPKDGPFVLELKGTWPDDCHPGEQKPVITAFDGTALDIDIEIVVEHVTCNDVPTDYRLLVDVSDAFEGDEDYNRRLDVTIRFGESVFTQRVNLDCALVIPCTAHPAQTWPEPGLYQGTGLAKQGLLLARQDGALAAYPLTYDEAGSAEWLFAGGTITGDAYFTSLMAASGGQCLGCPPPDEPPTMETVGDIAMVFDSQGVAQVKIDDGPFVEYRALSFGFADVGHSRPFPDLSGRWALLYPVFGTLQSGSVPPGKVLPLVVDLELVRSDFAPPSVIIGGAFWLNWWVATDRDGNPVAQLLCAESEDATECRLYHPSLADATDEFEVKLRSPGRLRLVDGRDLPDDVVPASDVLVRID